MTDHHDHETHHATSAVNHTINFAGLEKIVAALTKIAITPVLSALKTVITTLKRIEIAMATFKEQAESIKAELLDKSAAEHAEIMSTVQSNAQANVDAAVAAATATLTARITELEALNAANDTAGLADALESLRTEGTAAIDKISDGLFEPAAPAPPTEPPAEPPAA